MTRAARTGGPRPQRSRAARLDPYGIDEITLTLAEWRAARQVDAQELPFPVVDDGWRIDERTRRRGRRGLADARAALDRAGRRRSVAADARQTGAQDSRRAS